MLIEHNELLRIIHYDPQTGILTNKEKRPKTPIGKVIGNVSKSLGYVELRIKNRTYYAHRLIWFYVHGYWPVERIDHKNQIRHDNRLSNLRLAEQHQNIANRGLQRNNTSGYKGVTYQPHVGTYRARITYKRVVYKLGVYNTPEEAANAYDRAAERLLGPFAMTNRMIREKT